MKVLFLPEVRDYFRKLAEVLYENDYFGFEETAIQYVENLFTDIRNTLPVKYRKSAPIYFNKYGVNMFYAIFKRNKNTQWYVFFNIYEANGELIYLVRYISNNHMVSQLL